MALPDLTTFPPADIAAWWARVQKDLNVTSDDAPALHESLRWTLPDGFTLEPYYTAEDVANGPLASGQRSGGNQTPGWLNTPAYHVTDASKTNATLRAALGADAFLLRNVAPDALARLLNGLRLSDTPVFFEPTGDLTTFLKTLRSVAPYQLRGGLLADPITRWLETGEDVDATFARLPDALSATADAPQFRAVGLSSRAVHHAGGTAVQELAALLANAAEHFDRLTNAGVAVADVAANVWLSVPVGTSFFPELAKGRALRSLWARFLLAYDAALAEQPVFIHAETSAFYDAATTPYTNLLRSTTEAMSAVLGGADALTVRPYNAVFDVAENDFADRIARNVPLLLRDESFLDRVADPAAGSYYLETLTHELTEAAWAEFLRLEAAGGLIATCRSGQFPTEIDAAYQARVNAVRAGQVLVGVTKFRHDEAGESATTPNATLPGNAILPRRRLAEGFE